MQIHNEEISRFNLWFSVGYAVDKVQEILGCGKVFEDECIEFFLC